MGSTSASDLIHNLHLTSTNYFGCLNSSRTISRTSLLINQRKAAKLKFLSRKECKKSSRVVCCAVEDVTEEQKQELNSGVGSAVEDKPGKEKNPNSHLSFLLILTKLLMVFVF